MPALPAVSDVIRLQLTHTLGSDTDILNRMYFGFTGTSPTSTQLNTMASALNTAWGTNLAPLCTANVQLTAITIEDLTTSSSGVGTWSGTHSGSRGGTQLAAGTACLVNYKIARRYRGGKPRNYFPFGNAADLQTANSWTTTFTGNVLTGINAFITAVGTNVWSGGTISGQVNVSYYYSFTNFTGPTGRIRARSSVKVGPNLPIVPDLITGVSVNAKPASQRRRNTQKR